MVMLVTVRVKLRSDAVGPLSSSIPTVSWGRSSGRTEPGAYHGAQRLRARASFIVAWVFSIFSISTRPLATSA